MSFKEKNCFRNYFMVRKVLLTVLGCLALSTLAIAQKAGNDFKYSAPTVTLRENGARLDGTAAEPAHISSSELDVQALVIAFDFTQSQIQQVRAIGQVRLNLDLPGKDGAATTHVKATSDSATLNPTKRELILEGNVDGYYQIGNGARTALAGTKAVLNQSSGQLNATLQGPVRLVIPPESTSNNVGALGTIIITSQNAAIDQAKGQVVFSGQAHAVSTDSANQFDVSAPQFTLTRSANGSIDTLSTQGQTLVKIDLPPQPAKEGAKPSAIGKPTHVEVTSDAATVSRPDSKLTFTGNVHGFYVLAPAGQEPQKYNFVGDKAVLTQTPSTQDGSAGLNAQITGQPVTIFAPGLTFDMSGGKS
jgi:lipopolysaccharide export system protein LptA